MQNRKKIIKKVFTATAVFAMSVSLLPTFPSDSRYIKAETTAAKFAGANILAFPGVEGGGSYTSGGRGGDAYIVTNLKDYSETEDPIEGSLRYGIQSTPTEGRTIVFNVSGTIELECSLRFADIKNLTIAGQTAPGNGITLAGWDTNISNSENIIIRYIAFRPGATNVYNGSDSMDALWGRDNNYFVLDHCSFSWNTDETLSTYRGENGTIQWSIISESLTISGHSKGRHGYGGIAGGDNVTFHHNLYANHTSRNPRLGGGYAGKADADHVAVTQFSNNIIYNWGFNTCYGGGFTFTNFMNNIEIAGPGTRDNVVNTVINPGEVGKLGGFYINGNLINNVMTGTLDASSETVTNSGQTTGDAISYYVDEPYLSADSTGVNHGVTNEAFDSYVKTGVDTANKKLLNEILNKAGATLPKRDAIDARIVAEVKNDMGRYINTEDEVGGYVSPFGVIEAKHEKSYDTNNNGIADSWEKKNGIWKDKDAYKTVTKSGYTWLELYINSLADMDCKAQNPTATITSPAANEQFTLGDDITITVNAKCTYNKKVDSVAIYNGSEYLGDAKKANGDNYTYTLKNFKDDSYYISARVTDTAGNQTQTTAVRIHVNTKDQSLIDAGWTSVDIGNPDVKGSASLSGDVVTVKGSGKLGEKEGSVAGTKEADATFDDFHFVYKEMTGNTEFTVRLDDISNVDNHAFNGIMIRDDLENDSATAALGLSMVKISNAYCWSAYLASRDTKDGEINKLTETLDSPASAEAANIALLPDILYKSNGKSNGYWLKLGREGDTFFAYGSTDGNEWIPIGEKTVVMDSKIYVGMAVDSNDVANDIHQLSTAKFSNIEMKDYFIQIKDEEEEMLPLVTVTPSEIDDENYLTITKDTDKWTLDQKATTGQMTKSTESLAANTSYLVFPDSSDYVALEVDVKILSTTAESNNMGLFVGAFNIGDGKELYSSLGFRNGTSQTLTAFFSKLGKDYYAAGNGGSTTNNGSANTKPSYVIGETYHVRFEKLETGNVVYYTGKDENGDAIDAYKVFKATEAVLSSAEYEKEPVQVGLALIGVSAEIKNMTLYDQYGRVKFAQ